MISGAAPLLPSREQLEAEALPQSLGHHLDTVAAHSGARPAWIGIDGDDRIRSYGALADDVSRAANALRARGVRKGEHVGVLLPNGIDFLVAWLGLAKLGAVLVPLNPNVTAPELQHVLSDGDVERALVDAASAALFEETESGRQIKADGKMIISREGNAQEEWQALVAAAGSDFEYLEDVTLDDPVTIIYTSGSTGRPKGCLHTHRYWLTLGKVKASLLPPCERILCELPFYYMSPYYRFSTATFQAAAICVPPGPSIARFYKRLIENRIDIAWIGDPIATLPYPTELGAHSLKHVSLYGLKPDLHVALEQRLGIPVRESFGMTEIGPGLHMPAEDGHMTGSGSIGIPTAFRECMIADDQGNPLPAGEIGELCISGPGMFSGYYGNAEATAAAFWGKWFRTGDLARRDEQGYFYIVGRLKEMIKRSSENIAAQEVESVIYALPQVLEVAVIAVPDEKRGEEVKACVVLQEGLSVSDLPPEALIEGCSSRLASFKVPRYVQYYRELPKTSSQKIAKKLLADGAGVPLTETFDMRE
jgi:acyl-coenzyme A synthetase/AMP-(fatty) acid ligase